MAVSTVPPISKEKNQKELILSFYYSTCYNKKTKEQNEKSSEVQKKKKKTKSHQNGVHCGKKAREKQKTMKV